MMTATEAEKVIPDATLADCTDRPMEEKKEKAVPKPTDVPILFLASPTEIPTALPTPRADTRRIVGEGPPPTDIPTGIHSYGSFRLLVPTITNPPKKRKEEEDRRQRMLVWVSLRLFQLLVQIVVESF